MAVKLMIIDTQDIFTTGMFAFSSTAGSHGQFNKHSWLIAGNDVSPAPGGNICPQASERKKTIS